MLIWYASNEVIIDPMLICYASNEVIIDPMLICYASNDVVINPMQICYTSNGLDMKTHMLIRIFSCFSVDNITPEISDDLEEHNGFVFNSRRGTANFFR